MVNILILKFSHRLCFLTSPLASVDKGRQGNQKRWLSHGVVLSRVTMVGVRQRSHALHDIPLSPSHTLTLSPQPFTLNPQSLPLIQQSTLMPRCQQSWSESTEEIRRSANGFRGSAQHWRPPLRPRCRATTQCDIARGTRNLVSQARVAPLDFGRAYVRRKAFLQRAP